MSPSQYSFTAVLYGVEPNAVLTSYRRRTRQCCSVHLLSARLDGSLNFHVTRHQEEVCPLSREIMLQSLSAPLQDGIRFFLIPLPASPWAFLAVRLPTVPGENTGLPCTTNVIYEEVRPCLITDGYCVSVIPIPREFTYPRTFWFKPDAASNFGLFLMTVFNSSSHMLTIPS